MSNEMTGNELSTGETYFHQVEEAVDYLRTRVSHKPTIALSLESGFDDLIKKDLEDVVVISGAEIPHFPLSTAHGHAGNLVFGSLGGKNVVAFEGRVHTYEGYSAAQVAFGSLIAKSLGCSTFVFTTVAGSLNPAFRPGHLMVMTNHISLFCPDPAEGMQFF